MISNNPNTALVASNGSQYHDLNGLTDLKRTSRDNPDAAIDEVATQFESMFIQMMLKSMREALPKDGLFSSNDMDTYTEMADQQIAVNMAESGGIGLADVIARQLRPPVSVSELKKSDGLQQYQLEARQRSGLEIKPLTNSGPIKPALS
jgi:flagellar protein FlgJ